MNEWPTRVRTGVPPVLADDLGHGLRADQVVDDRLARVLGSRIAVGDDRGGGRARTPAAPGRRRGTRGRRRRRRRGRRRRRRRAPRAGGPEVLELDRVGRVVRERAVELAEQDRRGRTAGRRTPPGTTRPPMPLAVSATTRSGAQRRDVDEGADVRRRTSAQQVALLDPARRPRPARAGPSATVALISAQPGVLADRRGAGPAQLDAVVLRRVVAGGEHRRRARRAARRRSSTRSVDASPRSTTSAPASVAPSMNAADERLRRRPHVAPDEDRCRRR